VITTNIHRVKSIRLERIDFGNFISHQFTFETGDGEVCVSAFAPEPLEMLVTASRSADAQSVEVAS
jgi:hypothetical protein